MNNMSNNNRMSNNMMNRRMNNMSSRTPEQTMNRRQLMNHINEVSFAVDEVKLYLDTHPEDKKAFEMFKQLVEKFNKLKLEYENEFGPVEPYSAARFGTFNWLEGPWPWEKEANY